MHAMESSKELQIYSDSNAAYAALSTEQRIALLQQSKAEAITPEERERRQKEAEELDAKLRYIVNEVPNREYDRMGSMAGANSKTFDQYRSAKRREELRVAQMEKEERDRERQKRFREENEKKNAEEEMKRNKRRAKRLKEKGRKKKRTTGDTPTDSPPGAADTDPSAPVVQPELD